MGIPVVIRAVGAFSKSFGKHNKNIEAAEKPEVIQKLGRARLLRGVLSL